MALLFLCGCSDAGRGEAADAAAAMAPDDGGGDGAAPAAPGGDDPGAAGSGVATTGDGDTTTDAAPTAGAGGDGEAGAGATGGSDGANGDAGDASPAPTADCEALVTDPGVGWRASSLQTDQEIVECLASTLGRPVGYGAGARGGHDPGGASRLVVITKDGTSSPEEQLIEAIGGDEHTWIVFDKEDFAQETELAMYRTQCDDPDVTSHLGATAGECRDYRSWCSARGHADGSECLDRFFNQALNDGDLPIRNPVIGSNTTIDGRMTKAYFRFSGFAIGADSSGAPTRTAESVILTHLDFRGAGHTEDHGLDPDMIRCTGASHDIWIHRNAFDTTGDSAFDVKVGAHDITISFNRVVDVKRASLHGSSDSREINAQITTTIHHNAFITRDGSYDALGNTLRRVPLIRRGSSHVWNNLFANYRKDILSVRVGATVLWDHNAHVVHAIHQEKDSAEDSLAELADNLLRDVDGGNFRVEGGSLWFGDDACVIDDATLTAVGTPSGNVADLVEQYTSEARATIADVTLESGQELIDYVAVTAGPEGELPFNSPLAPTVDEVLAAPRPGCY